MTNLKSILGVILILFAVTVGCNQTGASVSQASEKSAGKSDDQSQPKTAGDRKVTKINGVEFAFRWCPAGKFMMGSPEGEEGHKNSETQHKVTLTTGFWMMETEVTQKQWQAIMGNNPSSFKGDDLPVENISWNDCQEFCRKCTQLGLSVQLPMEAQWEYACRAGSTTAYSWGNSLNGDMANCDGNYPYGTKTRGNNLEKTAPVASYKPNAWGLYDMHGNVWEWCQDWKADYPSGSVTNPKKLSNGSDRILRGGCWVVGAGSCRSALRHSDAPNFHLNRYGFRCAIYSADQYNSTTIAANTDETPAKKLDNRSTANKMVNESDISSQEKKTTVDTEIKSTANKTASNADRKPLSKKAIDEFGRPAVEYFEQMFQTGKFDFDFRGINGGNVLHYAALTGDLNRVKTLVEQDADVKAMNKENLSLNTLSFIRNYHQLFDQGPDVNAKNKSVIMIGKYVDNAVKREKGKAERNQTNDNDNSESRDPGYIWSAAARKENNIQRNYNDIVLNVISRIVNKSGSYSTESCTEKLNKIGFADDADVNAKSNYRKMVLHYAAQSGNLELVKWLFDKKEISALVNALLNLQSKPESNPNVKNFLGAIMQCAAQSGNLELLKWLAEKGLDVKIKSSEGYTVLNSAALSGNLEMVKWLVEQGLDVNAKSAYGWTVLHSAAKSGNLAMVQWLVEKGLGVNVKSEYGWTVLHSAAQSGNTELAQWLVSKGADVNAKNAVGWTPLHLAAFNGRLELVKWLVSKDADVNAEGFGGCFVMHCAAQSGNLELVKWLADENPLGLLKKNDDGWPVMLYAALSGNLELVQWLGNKGLNVKAYDEDGYTILHSAAESGNKELISWLLNQSLDVDLMFIFRIPNQRCMDGGTILDNAVQSGNLNLVQWLTEHGAEVKISTLHSAIQGGNLELVKWLIDEKELDINARGDRRKTALHFAVESGNLELVKWLLAHGADVDAKGWEEITVTRYYSTGEMKQEINIEDDGVIADKTALEYAVEKDNQELAKLLLKYSAKNTSRALINAADDKDWALVKNLIDHGTDVNVKDDKGNTVLHIVARNGNWELVKWLIDHGSDVNAKDKDGKTVFRFAVEKGNLELVKWLIEHGVDVNVKDEDGNSVVLDLAARNDNWELVKLMVEHKADINSKRNYETVLHYAVIEKNWEMVNWLLDHGADINAKGYNNMTVLHYVANKKNWERVKWFVEKGANVNAKDKDGITILKTAAFNGNLEMVKWLAEHGANVNEGIMNAAASGNQEIVKYLIEKGADVNSKTEDGFTSLHGAAQSGNLELAKSLVQKGLDVNAKTIKDGWTVVALAAWSGNLDLVKYLVEHGADVNAKDKGGTTVLHNAALSGNLELVKWLVEKGLDVNAKDNKDWYVIHSAARSGNLELVKWLNEHGANIFVKSNYDSTLLHVAAEKGHLQLVKWLVEEKGLDVNAPNGSDQTPMMLAALEDKYDVRDWLEAKGGVPTVRNEKFHEEFNKEWQEHLQQRKEQWWKLP